MLVFIDSKYFYILLDVIVTICHIKNFIDISLNNKWNTEKVRSNGLSKKLNKKHPLFQDLYRAYTNCLNSNATILNKSLEFYGSITYTVLKDDQEPIRLKLQVGDIVELNEESEGIAYAKIESLIRHQANNGQYYAFFLFNWFQATNYIDSMSGCPFYNIQRSDESRWFRIFPINYVDHMPSVHFIHDCKRTCDTKHDENNRSYILNQFYYKAV